MGGATTFEKIENASTLCVWVFFSLSLTTRHSARAQYNMSRQHALVPLRSEWVPSGLPRAFGRKADRLVWTADVAFLKDVAAVS